MKAKWTILLLTLLLIALPASAQDATGEATPEATITATAASTETATAEATSAATTEATTEATSIATEASTEEATRVATTEATEVATAEATVEATVPPTPIPFVDNPEGVKIITGQYAYTDPALPTYNSEVGIALLDISGAVTHTFDPVTGFNNLTSPQFLGKITSDINQSPFDYELRLPDIPGGVLHDLNHDGKTDTGVMVYDVNFVFNIIGDAYMQPEDPVWASTDLGSENFRNYGEIVSGKLVIYSPDDAQSFPSGFGADGLLFSNDDPIAPIGQGWTVVNLDTQPFTFDHGETATADILEAPLQATPTFTDQTYSQAFDSMIATMRRQYAYAAYYDIDWDALIAKYRPRFVKAEQDKSVADYETAVRDFIREFTDIHVGVDASPYLNSLPNPLTDEIKGGIGMTVRELDDGRVIVNYITHDGPADQAGIQVRAELVRINGKSAKDAVASATALNPPDLDYNHADVIRLDKERGLMRFPVGAEVKLTYRNPDDSHEKTVTLTATDEDDSRLASRTALYGPDPVTDVPLEYRLLDSGYGYVKINSFFDDGVLTNALWKRAIELFKQVGVTGIIIDLRNNGGGWDFNGSTMLGYFYDTQQETGGSADYFPDIDRIEVNPLAKGLILPTANVNDRFHGKIAVMVSPFCVSECEFFSDALQRTGRATIIGQYHTAGGGGSIQNIYLPEGVEIQFTFSRGLDPQGKVKIQGTGVVPDIKVPVTEDTVFAADAVLDAATKYLDDATAIKTEDGGTVAVGDSLSGKLEQFSAVEYTFTATEDVTLKITLTDPETALDTMLIVYDADGNELAENDDSSDHAPNSEISDLEVKAGETITIDASTYDPTDSGDYTLTVAAA